MAKNRKKPPAHEVIVRRIQGHVKKAEKFYRSGGITGFFINGVYLYFLPVAELTKVLLGMHIPEQARLETAKAVYAALMHLKELELHGRHIRKEFGENPLQIRARIRSGR